VIFGASIFRHLGFVSPKRSPHLSRANFFPEFVDSGGLMYYGVSAADNQIEQFRYAARYVDRILKGTKPGDLPVQSTNKFVLQINRKTVAAFGLKIPPKLLFTADRVIE